MAEELDREEFTGSSAFQKLLNRFQTDSQNVDLDIATRVRQADVDFDLTLNDLTDGYNNGSLFRDEESYLAAVESAKRGTQAYKNSVLLEEAQRKADIGKNLQNVQRFFALDPKEIETTVPKDSSFRLKIVQDPNNPGSYKQVEDPTLDTPEVRAKEVASFFDIPEEAVLAKQEQEAAIAAKLLSKQQVAARQESAEQRAAAKELRAQTRFEGTQRFKTSALGFRQEAMKRTKGIPPEELRSLLSDTSVSQEERTYIDTALKHKEHLENYRDERDIRKLQAVEARKFYQDLRDNFIKDPSLVAGRYIKKDGSFNDEAALIDAHNNSKKLARQNELEFKQYDLEMQERDFGPGGTFVKDLDGPERTPVSKVGALLGAAPSPPTEPTEPQQPTRSSPSSPLLEAARSIRATRTGLKLPEVERRSPEEAQDILAQFQDAQGGPSSPLVNLFRRIKEQRLRGQGGR